MTEDKLLTTREAAERLNVSRHHLKKLIRAGRLDAIDVGSGNKVPRYRISTDAIRKYIEQHGTGSETGNTPPPGGSSGGVRVRGRR